jgi:hypothetical protein
VSDPINHAEYYPWGRISFWRKNVAVGDYSSADTMQFEVGFGLQIEMIQFSWDETRKIEALKRALHNAFNSGEHNARQQIREALGVKEER